MALRLAIRFLNLQFVPHLRTSTNVTTSFRSLSYKTQRRSRPHHAAGRWLWNEEINQKLRYTPFNVEALKSIACQAASARRCTRMVNIGQGAYNKVFVLQFDNGKDLAVRIPCPVAGNISLATESEAATMEYVRLRCTSSTSESCPLPKIPRILSWDSSFTSAVEWPYIICEYIPGVPLDTMWLYLPDEPVLEVIHSLVRLETKILQDTFSQHGSIFFAENVNDELRERPLYAEPPTDPLLIALAGKFRIGPSVDREWWRGAYGQVVGNRGPWPDFSTMISSAAEFQLRCLDNGFDHTLPYVQSTAKDIPLIRRILKMCIDMAPLIVPKASFMQRPVLNHPYLTLRDIIVPSKGDPKVEGIIDWQGAQVAPFCIQSFPPHPMFFTGGIDAASNTEVAGRLEAYCQDAVNMIPERLETLRLPRGAEKIFLLRFILRCLADGPDDLCTLLIGTQQDWNLISDDPCPINFSAEEQETYLQQRKELLEDEEAKTKVQELLGCRDNGWVGFKSYEEDKQTLKKQRSLWEKSRSTPFPFFDGAPCVYLS